MPYLVAFTIEHKQRTDESGKIIGEPYTDHWQVFCDNEEPVNETQALELFNSLSKQDNIYTVSVAKIIKSSEAHYTDVTGTKAETQSTNRNNKNEVGENMTYTAS